MAKKAAKTKTAKSGAKPKTMATRRVGAVERVGEVVRSIVETVLAQRKPFTSLDIVRLSGSSGRHSRRTLAWLVQKNALRVERSERPYRYQVASREQLRKLS